MSPVDALEHRRIPTFMLRGFWDELDRRGVPAAELERASGVSRPTYGDFLTCISSEAMHRLFAAAQQLTKDERIGLSVGRAIGASSFHLVGHLVLASPSLEMAIEFVSRAEPHFGQRLPKLQPLDAGRMRFGVVDSDAAHTPGGQVEAELTAVMLYDVARLFLDERHGSPTVQFAFSAPQDCRPYLSVFHGDLEFGREGTFCVFPRAALRRRSGTDTGLLKHLFSLARDHYGGAREEEDWTWRVRAALRAQLAPRLVDPIALASQLGLSPSALARRLAREGSSLSRLVDEVLFERACAALRQPRVTVAQVAEQLGYAELSSFFRAFRRWSGGLTPREYAQQGK